MQLPPLATNTTNTNWWIFPSLLEVVNIPPPPHPTRLALVPLLVEVIVCLLVLFACFFCLSICQYSFPLVLSLSPAKMYTLLHLTSILIQICGLERPATTTNKQKKKMNMTHETLHSLSEKLDRECWPDRQTFSMGSLFSACPGHCLHSLSDNYLHMFYMHM